MSLATADLCDAHPELIRVAEPLFRRYGAVEAFHGPIATVRIFEDNVLVKRSLQQPGHGRVLVVDGGGSLRCALMGDLLAQMALDNGWAGAVINGCIRDSSVIAGIRIGIRALATHPCKSRKKGHGETEVELSFAGTRFRPGEYLYADADGIIVSPNALTG